MCGITGFFSYKNNINAEKYYQAHKKIAHRGPDDEGFIYKDNLNQIEHLKGNDTIVELQDMDFICDKEPSSLILGHRRLSIIDLSAKGHQPYSFDGLYLTYNGEIYNYIELREELINLGYKFETNSDTEVFLKSYHYWGCEAFNRFNGMWAGAIYDSNKDDILLTRDRFGIKPLYYSIVGDNLIFGSEIKFVSSFMGNLYANKQMVYEYIRFNHINHTKYTMFKDIFQLEPSNYMKFSRLGISFVKYWNLEHDSCVSNKNDIEEELNSSIERRMRSDVEVGSLLSGGIDSSSILGIIDNKNFSKNFNTFSAVFEDENFSEKKYIDKFKTKNINLKKHFIYPEHKSLSSDIDNLIYTQEEPFRSLAVFSQYEIYKYIKKNTNVKVLLNGQGADEIFTGYIQYYYAYLAELLRTFKFTLFFKEFGCIVSNQGFSKIFLLKNIVIVFLIRFRAQDKYKIFTRKFEAHKLHNKFKNLLKNSLYNSLTFCSLREYLMYEDKNSMRFSLESRLPFLDFKLVHKAFSLRDQDKIKNGISKVVLRDIVKDKIPLDTLNRKDKMGFISPQEVWQKSIFKDEIDIVYESIKNNELFDFIDNKKVYSLYCKYKNNKMNDWALIYRIYLLYKWKKVWNICTS